MADDSQKEATADKKKNKTDCKRFRLAFSIQRSQRLSQTNKTLRVLPRHPNQLDLPALFRPTILETSVTRDARRKIAHECPMNIQTERVAVGCAPTSMQQVSNHRPVKPSPPHRLLSHQPLFPDQGLRHSAPRGVLHRQIRGAECTHKKARRESHFHIPPPPLRCGSPLPTTCHRGNGALQFLKKQKRRSQ